MKKFATQAMMLFAASYFLSFIFVSQIALLKCANEDDTRYSCPLLKPYLRMLYKHFFAGVIVDPVMAYLENFDSSIINLLIFSGYLAFVAELIAITYALIRVPFVTFSAICSLVMRFMLIIAISLLLLRLANDDDWQQKMQSSNALQYLNQIYHWIYRNADHVAQRVMERV